jgi:hypothetical protein
MKKRMNYNSTQNIIISWPAFITDYICYVARLQDFLNVFSIIPPINCKH